MQPSEIDPNTAHGTLGTFEILDVRESFELEGPLGALADAVHVPLGEVASRATTLDPAKRFLLVCRSGKRSASACQVLCEHGIKDVTNLVGGMIAWNRAGLPIVRTRFDSPQALLESLTRWLAQVTGTTPREAAPRVAGWLQQPGASAGGVTQESIEHALARLEQTLRNSGAPADLDLALAAYRRDLAAF